MTAPVANPSWALKIERVRRKIRALESQKDEPGADLVALQAGIAAHEVEIAAIRRDWVKEVIAAPMPTGAGIYGRVVRA